MNNVKPAVRPETKLTAGTALNLKDMSNMTNLKNAGLITAKQYSHAINWMKMKGFLPTDFRIVYYEEGMCVGTSKSSLTILWEEDGKAFLIEPPTDEEKMTLFWNEETQSPMLGKPLHLTERRNLNINLNMFDRNENSDNRHPGNNIANL